METARPDRRTEGRRHASHRSPGTLRLLAPCGPEPRRGLEDEGGNPGAPRAPRGSSCSRRGSGPPGARRPVRPGGGHRSPIERPRDLRARGRRSYERPRERHEERPHERANGRVNGLGEGRVNGLTNGAAGGLTFGRGATNGLVNGNGFTNGRRGRHPTPRIPAQPHWSRSVIGIAAVVALMVIVPILASMLSPGPTAPSSIIQIDGNFGDWSNERSYGQTFSAPVGNPSVH